MAESSPPRLLFVHESVDARNAFQEALGHAFEILCIAPGDAPPSLDFATSAERRRAAVDVVVGSGRALGAAGITALVPSAPRILLISEDDRGMLQLWMERLAPYLVMRAPWGFEEIRLAALRAVEWSLAQLSSGEGEDIEPSSRNSSFAGNILTNSPPMVRVLQQIEALADADVSVLVTGETGVGKELVARTIHEQSPRNRRRFVAQNLAALPAELMTSELFGHVKGAFTGAQKERRGLFELADGGTLFLDEIGEAPPALQALLLRALETREFWPVGASEPRQVNVRVVAATNRDLFVQAQQGFFRLDLYYRLAVTSVHIPPLRERADDIRLIGQVFLEQSAQRLGRREPRVSEEAWMALEDYPWPGNVRELGNVMERLCIYHPGAEVTPAMLALPELADAAFPSWNAPGWPERGSTRPSDSPLSSRLLADRPSVARNLPPESRRGSKLDVSDLGGGSLVLELPDAGTTFEDLERQILVQVLERAAGNQSRAARALGLSESTLRSRLKRLGLKG